MFGSEKGDYEEIVNQSKQISLPSLKLTQSISSSKNDNSLSMFSLNNTYMSFNSKTSQDPKIPNKTDRQKFEFIFKRSMFRYLCAFYKDKFIEHTNSKKVQQNKLIHKTTEFI